MLHIPGRRGAAVESGVGATREARSHISAVGHRHQRARVLRLAGIHGAGAAGPGVLGAVRRVCESQAGHSRVRSVRSIPNGEGGRVPPRTPREGRPPGACVDISGLLSRFLDRLGVWNYVVKGGLVLEFSATTGISPTYFWPIMAPGNPAIAGHTWVCAPPFKVIDISASAQPYRHSESAYISGYIAEENPTPVPARSVSVVDLLDSDVRNPFIRDHGRLPTMDELGDGAKWIPLLGAFQVSRPNVTMRYIGTAVGASDVGIDKKKYPTLSGLSPADAWNEFCDPK